MYVLAMLGSYGVARNPMHTYSCPEYVCIGLQPASAVISFESK